jgi:hypothetical protein
MFHAFILVKRLVITMLIGDQLVCARLNLGVAGLVEGGTALRLRRHVTERTDTGERKRTCGERNRCGEDKNPQASIHVSADGKVNVFSEIHPPDDFKGNPPDAPSLVNEMKGWR